MTTRIGRLAASLATVSALLATALAPAPALAGDPAGAESGRHR